MTVFVVLENNLDQELPVVRKRGLEVGLELARQGDVPALFRQDEVGDVLKHFNNELGMKKRHFVVKGIS